MDQKQFEALQTGIQWVVDEARLREAYWAGNPEGKQVKDPDHLSHRQGIWGGGKVTHRLRQAVKRITHDVKRESSYQYNVVCPSACCLAGNIVLAAGDEFVVADANPGHRTERVELCMDPEGTVRSINQRAMELAGLTSSDAKYLFAEGLQPDTQRKNAATIAKRSGFDLEVI